MLQRVGDRSTEQFQSFIVRAAGEYMMSETSNAHPITVGLLVPQTGPIGMFGPSMVNSASIAVDDLNAAGGLLRRQLRLIVGEAGGDRADIVEEAERLIRQKADVIIGSHVSPNRKALVKSIGQRLPYIYSTMYEGGEHSRGVFICGETPEQGLFPLIEWLTSNKGSKRWYILGSDYDFPRASAALAKSHIAKAGCEVVGEEYLPLDQTDYHQTLRNLREAEADTVLLYLIGNDGIYFNRQFADLGLPDQIIRAYPIACENTLLGIGVDATRNLYMASSYSRLTDNGEGEWLRNRYRMKFGETAPVVTHHTAALYDGVLLFAALARSARSLLLSDLQAASEGLVLNGARGTCVMRSNHLSANMSIVQADGFALRSLETVGRSKVSAP